MRFVFFLLVALSTPVHAETPTEAGLDLSCREDLIKFCTELKSKSEPEKFSCLVAHQSEVSTTCQTGLAALPISKAPTLPPKARPGFAALGSMGMAPSRGPSVSYGASFTPVNNGGIEQHRLLLQAPVYQKGRENISVSAGAVSLHTGTPGVLSGSNIDVPNDLWKIDLGASYFKMLDDDRFQGARIGIGSASDHPFEGIGVTTIGASAFYSWAASAQSRWVVSLFFSNNNPILNYIPIPGFIYLYQTENFVGMFGFPFTSVVWLPSHLWTFTFSAFGPTLNAEIAFGKPSGAQAYAGFSWLQQSFLRKDRPDDRDRLYFDEKRLPIGIRFPVATALKADFSTGYAFDRSFYEGTHVFGQKENGETALGNSWFLAGNLRLDL